MRGPWRGVALSAAWLLAGCFSSNGAALQLDTEGGAGGDGSPECAATDDCAGSAAGSGGSGSRAGTGDVSGTTGTAGVAGGLDGTAGAAGAAGVGGVGTGGFAGVAGSAGAAGAAGVGGVGTGGFAGVAGGAGVAGFDGGGMGGDTGGMGGMMPPPEALDGCDAGDAYEPLSPLPGEVCYELPIHGVSGPMDETPFTIYPGESYQQFYYDRPWAEGRIATRVGTVFDNLQIIHAWRLFSSTRNIPGGTVETNVTGTVLGENADLLAAWHVGGCNLVFPDDVALELPGAGKVMLQVHFYNATGVEQTDATRVQVCTALAGARPNIAGLTFLGSENLNGLAGMPPGENEFTTRCRNDSTGPITIVIFRPHMHWLGTEMRSVVQHADGSSEVIFDQPFVFDYQIHYPLEPRPVMAQGDAIETTCRFFNDTGQNVSFGESTNQEMCYQLTYSYPAGALGNGVLSLIGANNTCW